MKSVLNGIIYYAIELEIIEHNYLRDINYKQFRYKAENNNILPFTEEERLKIIAHLPNDDLYSLALKFDFHMILRIGELKGLKWSDIKGDYIYIPVSYTHLDVYKRQIMTNTEINNSDSIIFVTAEGFSGTVYSIDNVVKISGTAERLVIVNG